MIETYAASQAASAAASAAGANRGTKRNLVLIGCVIVLSLAVVDCLLLYLWINAGPTRTKSRNAQKLGENPDQDYDYSGSPRDPPLEDFPDSWRSSVRGQDGAGRFCSTTACAWLEEYLGQDVATFKQPCEDFYAHVCTQHTHSVYVDGRARLMVAMEEELLGKAPPSAVPVAGQRNGRQSRTEHAAMFQRCLAGGQPMLSTIDVDGACEEPSTHVCPSRTPEAPTLVSDEFFRRTSNATVEEFVAFINRAYAKQTLNNTKDRAPSEVAHRGGGWNSSSFSTNWVTRVCQWVSLSARCYLLGKLQRSGENLRQYQRAWKIVYFAPFMGASADPLGLVYRDPPRARLQACLNIMADAFEAESLDAAKQVLSDAVDDLDGLLSDLGRDAHQMMVKFFRFTAAQGDAEAGYPAFPHDLRSAEKEDISTRLLGPSNSAAVNMTLFSSEVCFAYNEQQRRLLVAPGLLGLLVNATSNLEPLLVPAMAAPVLRAMLRDKWFENAQAVSPARLVRGVSQCLATQVNVSGSVLMATAAELVILEPLLQLYRKRLADSEGSGTLLHPGYTNGQLFFVLWALGHCGELEGSTVVNAVASNSGHFSKAFQCTRKNAMSAVEKCPLSSQK